MAKELTSQECVDLIAELSGKPIALSTFWAYVHRGQAPAAKRRVGRTPLWLKSEIVEWATNRPGAGARTDLSRKHSKS